MTPDRRPVYRRMSFDEFVAEHVDRENEEPDAAADESPIPENWQERPRKRASGEPPDFEAEKAHALAWARQHCGCWKPEIVSYKRLEGGKTAALIRDRLGSAITFVLDRGNVVDVDEANAFRRMEEVLG